MATAKKKKIKVEDLGHVAHSKAAQGVKTVKESRPLKIVFLGSGSGFFGSLFRDILMIDGFNKGEMCIVDIDKKRLDLSERVGYEMMKRVGNNGWKLTKTTARRKVLKNADYVINCIEVNGAPCVRPDNDIPLKYGVDQCIGDTIGPGGIMKALRTVPTWLDVLKDIEELCPNAVVFNYTNPMSIMCLAATRAFPKIKHFGMCHSVQGTSERLASYAGVPLDEIKWECAGVNHLAWFTKFEHNGKDLYPVINKRLKSGEVDIKSDYVRFDMMQHFGAFITESSGHLSEYLPFYRKRKDLRDKYCGEGYNGGSSFYADNWPKWRKDGDTWRAEFGNGEHKDWKVERSWEYSSYAIEALEMNRPFVMYATVPNTGLISNLPQDGVVEVACHCDKNGIVPCYFGALPAQMAAPCDWNMRCYELAAQACLDFDLEKAILAMTVDPHTASVCCPAEVRKMAKELFAAEKAYLDPRFFKKGK
jgi:alpha-galactosidase